jgi:hypothetical protein
VKFPREVTVPGYTHPLVAVGTGTFHCHVTIKLNSILFCHHFFVLAFVVELVCDNRGFKFGVETSRAVHNGK